jgi:probable rRNA maturation factor
MHRVVGRTVTVVNESQLWNLARTEWVWARSSAQLRLANAARWRLSVLLTTDEAMRTLNRETRGIDATTDVLSFPTVGDELARPGHLPPTRGTGSSSSWPDLGEIVISASYVEAARGDAETLDDALARTLAHGLCHLLGFDHTTDGQEALMLRAESALMLDSSKEEDAYR